MKTILLTAWLGVALWLPGGAAAQSETPTNNPVPWLMGALDRVVSTVAPGTNAPATFTATLKITRAGGLPKELADREFELAFQAPDRLRLSAVWEHQELVLGRDRQQVWVYEPSKKFALLGTPDTAPFAGLRLDHPEPAMNPIQLPFDRDQLALAPFLLDVKALPDEVVAGAGCHVIKVKVKPEIAPSIKMKLGTLQLWVRTNDSLPLRLAYQLDAMDLQVDLVNPKFNQPWTDAQWALHPAAGDNVTTVARSHLTRFFSIAMEMLNDKIPTLGPATGEHHVIAREGAGRLESVDGTRVLVLKGTPEEMGLQHGRLMKKEIHGLVDRILFGVGVGSSFEKGTWVLGEIESAQKRLAPFVDARYFREMDALADAAAVPRQEARLANLFPEMFHCSGFALFGKATTGGRLYHGRILDYLRGMGLEQNAVVMVFQPDQGNAWVNVGYAGFIGSVTAMNSKHIAMGEMGGKGQGNWDGKPMAELVREVMEKAGTLDEAVEIMRKGPRTCAYYYVISDANTHSAVGIAATPESFEVIKPGESNPLLPHPAEDTVLMSAGDRYEELSKRVHAGFGSFDDESARNLMRRPVCMTSNIHCALFAPDTLDFWVANADSEHPAAHTRYTHYNLAELLKAEPGQ